MTETKPTQSPLSKIFGGRERPHIKVAMPLGNGVISGEQVALVVLNRHEIAEARVDTINFLLKTMSIPEWWLETDEGQRTYNNELVVQLLFQCMRQPANLNVTFASTKNEVRTLVEPSILDALHTEWVNFQNSRNPLHSLKTDEEVKEIIATLGKDSIGRVELLSFLDTDSLRRIVLDLIDQLKKPTT